MNEEPWVQKQPQFYDVFVVSFMYAVSRVVAFCRIECAFLCVI